MSILSDEQMQDFEAMSRIHGVEFAIKSAEKYLQKRLRRKGLRKDEQTALLEALRKELSATES